MQYGFEDDKSKFDLSNMTDSYGSFTPNTSQTNVSVTSIQCMVHGSLGLLTGTLTFTNASDTVWYVIGTLSGISVVKQSYATVKVWEDVGATEAIIRVDIDGTVRVRPWAPISNDDMATGSFSVTFKATPA